MRILILAAAGWFLIYAARCAWRPLATCRSCRGAAFLPRRSRLMAALRGPRTCRRCRGVGTRIRLGRRAYDHLRRLQRAGTR
jgi:hypothetical protein